MKTFKALSALLMYPEAELQEAIGAIRALLAEEEVISSADRTALEPLLESLQCGDLYDLQEAYVLLFDRSRTLSLNLFEHVHGESRDRGGAMVDLLETYRENGFDLVGTELPDFLPVLLEFLATQPLTTAREILADAGHILVALAERLERRNTPYAAVLQALVRFSQASAQTEEAQALLAQKDDDPEDLAALDAVWQEAQVTFGPDPDAGCPTTEHVAREFPIRIERRNAPMTQREGG